MPPEYSAPDAPAGEMHDKTPPEDQKPVEFDPPPGLKTPDGVGEDEDWEMVSTFRTKADGQICIVKIGDVKMPGYDDKKSKAPPTAKDEKPDFSSMMPEGQGTA